MHRPLISVCALSLTAILAGCGPKSPTGPQAAAGPATGAPIDSLPLAGGAPAAPASEAPAATQLAPAPPIRLAASGVAREPYRYIDDAADLGDAFADSPPDYTVDYDGTRPWIWRAEDGAYRVVEQTPDGERDYYYHPGADSPFLVRDRANAYAYDGGQLVVVYDSAGRPIDRSNAGRDAEIAAAYLARARHLYTAAVHNQRQAAYAAEWEARRDAVLQSQRDWADQQRANDDWRRWRAARDHSHQAALDQERAQRQTDAAQAAGIIAGANIPRRSDHADDRGGDAPTPIVHALPQPPPAAAARHQQDAGPPQQTQAAALRHPVAPARPPQTPLDGARHSPEQARPQQAQAETPRPKERARPQQAPTDASRHSPEPARPQQAQADAARHPAEQPHPPQVRADAPRHPPEHAAQVPPAHPVQIPHAPTPPARAEARQPQVRPAQAETTHRQPTPSPAPAKPDAGRVPDPAHEQEHDKSKTP